MSPVETAFGAFSEDYERYRPGYPDALWDLLALPERARVADLGAGTGRAARAAAARGYRVTAVEPDPEMAQVARTRNTREGVKIGVVEAPAEQTGLGAASQDAVIAAQAYHWFEIPAANQEIWRILKPGGCFAAFWNDRQVEGTPWLEAFERLIVQYNPSHSRDYRKFDVEARIQDGARYSEIESHAMPHAFPIDLEGFVGLARTFSYVRGVLHPSDLVRFEGELRELLTDAHGGEDFEVPFVLNVTVARRV